ncbi:MAG: extracellular solute-binding protein [Acidobacteria bacterium]|nr:extracellular solute-binding protein [Acidobacteriota bacterium]
MKRMAALAAVLALAAGTGGCGGGGTPASDTDALVIYSAHSDEIIAEFTGAFKAWYTRETGRDVDVAWPDPGGGGTFILKRLQDKFHAGRYDVDVAYGGGMIFEQMKQLGMLEPYKLPAEVLAAIPPKVAGQPIYDPDFSWYGPAISTFGLIINKTLIADKGLPEVTDWASPADPKYFGLAGAGDPSKSGSLRKAYEIILQAYGYEKGMSILVRTGANAREFASASSDIPRNCAKGFIAAGPCIDFYAYRQMHSEGGKSLGFVAPPGLTVVNCDPVAILKNAPHRRVAERFVEFVMRPEGQRLWMLPAGAPGGPKKFALMRLAVLPSVHEEARALGTDIPFAPFSAPAADFYDAEKENARQTVLADYLRVTLVENHDALRKAWKAVIDAGLPPDRVAELVRPLVSEDEMLRLGREVWQPVVVPDGAPADEQAALKREQERRQRARSDVQTQWSAQARAKYEALAK